MNNHKYKRDWFERYYASRITLPRIQMHEMSDEWHERILGTRVQVVDANTNKLTK